MSRFIILFLFGLVKQPVYLGERFFHVGLKPGKIDRRGIVAADKHIIGQTAAFLLEQWCRRGPQPAFGAVAQVRFADFFGGGIAEVAAVFVEPLAFSA